mmetsp:Transcript_2298/g.8538  ORF Transcript_2298/g.8538 Transcript_2298/m.8538 type:complete len:137 (-) Transcript_2298:1935-2345(-)
MTNTSSSQNQHPIKFKLSGNIPLQHSGYTIKMNVTDSQKIGDVRKMLEKKIRTDIEKGELTLSTKGKHFELLYAGRFLDDDKSFLQQKVTLDDRACMHFVLREGEERQKRPEEIKLEQRRKAAEERVKTTSCCVVS